MRKIDKLKNYEQANLMLEQSYLKSNRVSEDSTKKGESDKRKAELDVKEKEYRSKLSPDQLKNLTDSEIGEHRHEVMLGNAPLYTDGYFTYYHTRKNKWDK
jgi:hypothetical protein